MPTPYNRKIVSKKCHFFDQEMKKMHDHLVKEHLRISAGPSAAAL
jgi:hypothetical protein